MPAHLPFHDDCGHGFLTLILNLTAAYVKVNHPPVRNTPSHSPLDVLPVNTDACVTTVKAPGTFTSHLSGKRGEMMTRTD